MAKVENLAVKDLELDLDNYRTTSQDSEIDAIKAMIAISPGNFYGVFESTLNDGFLPLENLIIQKVGQRLVVREGNRRTASLKICLGLIDVANFSFATQFIDKVMSLSSEWKNANTMVPCLVYSEEEKSEANRIVGLIHAKGKKAGRDPWKAIAKARFNRDEEHRSEPGLNLLESFLDRTSELSDDQKYKWSGTYPITVLDEAIKKVAPALSFKDAPELGKRFPTIPKVNEVDKLIYDIGTTKCKFKTIRQEEPNFLDTYALRSSDSKKNKSTDTDKTNKNTNGNIRSDFSKEPESAPNTVAEGQDSDAKDDNHPPNSNNRTTPTSNITAYPINDLRHVKNLLSEFQPKGKHRAKVASLRDEMQKLSLKSTPIAFCLVLRSLFEISAKAYCKDHNIKTTSNNGNDLKLVDLLRRCVSHLTNNQQNQQMIKELHGALAELATNENLISITSMNQLTHNPVFSILPDQIAVRFSNVYPLLEKLNG